MLDHADHHQIKVPPCLSALYSLNDLLKNFLLSILNHQFLSLEYYVHKNIYMQFDFPFLESCCFSISPSSCHVISLFASKFLEKWCPCTVSVSSPSIFSVFVSNQSSSLHYSTQVAPIMVKNCLHCLKLDVNFLSLSWLNYQQHLTPWRSLALLK